MPIDLQCVWSDIQAIKKISPLVHNITNYVVMEQTANSLLAMGASPVMAHALEEAEEMASLANSLVLNMGTLSPSWIESMILAMQAANTKGIAVVFDPVGAGATHYRAAAARRLLDHGVITAIRGNASEIVYLSEHRSLTKGVDSLLEASDYIGQAKMLALKHHSVVWMSGKTDVVTDGQSVVLVHNGHPLMGKITGMGCSATAITGAFLAVNQNTFQGCVHAALVMGIVGEMAADMAHGPGSFKSLFLDTLYAISLSKIEERIRAEIL